MPLLPHQERVVVERSELFDKLVKLRVFVQSSAFEKVEPDERQRLSRQHDIMKDYLSVLDERIEAFTGA